MIHRKDLDAGVLGSHDAVANAAGSTDVFGPIYTKAAKSVDEAHTYFSYGVVKALEGLPDLSIYVSLLSAYPMRDAVAHEMHRLAGDNDDW